MKNIILILIVSACASNKIENDKVSVGTALELAANAYRLGCVTTRKQMGWPKGSFNHCTQEAKKYIENDVKPILEQ